MAGEREFHALKPSTAKEDCANDVRQNCMSRFRGWKWREGRMEGGAGWINLGAREKLVYK